MGNIHRREGWIDGAKMDKDVATNNHTLCGHICSVGNKIWITL